MKTSAASRPTRWISAIVRVKSWTCSTICDMWIRSNAPVSRGQGKSSRSQTMSAADRGETSMPTAPGSAFRFPQPTSRTISLLYRAIERDHLDVAERPQPSVLPPTELRSGGEPAPPEVHASIPAVNGKSSSGDERIERKPLGILLRNGWRHERKRGKRESVEVSGDRVNGQIRIEECLQGIIRLPCGRLRFNERTGTDYRD